MLSTSVTTLPRAPQAVRTVRSLLWMSFECWRLDLSRLDDAALVLSELVGNAVRHGAGDTVRVALHRDGDRLRITVDDDSPQPPAPRQVDWDAEGGRGMMIIEALASGWGHALRGPGKSVWAEVPC